MSPAPVTVHPAVGRGPGDMLVHPEGSALVLEHEGADGGCWAHEVLGRCRPGRSVLPGWMLRLWVGDREKVWL